MSYIKLTPIQADSLKGNYGIPRGTDNTYPHMVEPVSLPDGNFLLNELGSPELSDVNETLISYATPTNTQDEIPDLPEIGEECVKDVIYKYDGGEDNKSTGLVICAQTHNRTIYPPEQTPALFSFFRENSDTLEWIPNEWVELGWKRVYGGKTYEVIQAHQTLETWTPDVTPSLWKEKVADIPVFVQPTGAHDAYRLGAKVHFPTITDPIYESLIDYNTYSPAVYPAGWKKL